MKKKALLFFIVAITYGNAISQDVREVTPPPPGAAALAKYADVPVSLYSGIPDISLPIYTLKCGDLSLPISLSYHASGVKVEEVPNNVGLGWVLNAGGIIARTVRGSGEGIYPNGIFPRVDQLPINSNNWNEQEFNKVVNLASGIPGFDTEPDIFYYNFNGRTGTFYLDKNGKPVQKMQSDLKIEFVFANGKIVITTEDGTKYHFDSTGNLEKISDAFDKHFIYFTYYTEFYRNLNVPRFSRYYYFPLSNIHSVEVLSLSDPTCNLMEYGESRIKSIYTSDNDSILFVPKTSNRIDVDVTGYTTLPAAKALERVIIKNSANQIVKKFRLVTNAVQTIKPYATKLYGTFCPNVGQYNFYNYRLYLDELVEESINSPEQISHKFEYYGRTSDGRDSLANRLSCAQDWIGFYNGQDNNIDLIPQYYGAFYGTDALTPDCVRPLNYSEAPTIISGNNTNREAMFKYTKLGTLKSIQYPTRGFAKFTYGPHLYQGNEFGGIRIKQIEYGEGGTIHKTKKYSYYTATLGYELKFFNQLLYNPATNDMTIFNHCFDCHYSQPPCYNHALQLSTGSLLDLGLFEGPMIGYSTVTESETGNGLTEYDFTNPSAAHEGEYSSIEVIGYSPSFEEYVSGGFWYMSTASYFWPLGPYPDISWKRGLMTAKRVYGSGTGLLSSEKFSYTFLEGTKVPAVKITTIQPNQIYGFFPFNYTTCWARLDSTSQVQYFPTGAYKVKSEFEYASSKHKQVTKETTSFLSDGSKRVTTYKYPLDYSGVEVTAEIGRLQSLGIISPVMEKIEYIEKGPAKKVKAAEYVLFDQVNGTNIVKPKSIYSYKGNTAVDYAGFTIRSVTSNDISTDNFNVAVNYTTSSGTTPVTDSETRTITVASNEVAEVTINGSFERFCSGCKPRGYFVAAISGPHSKSYFSFLMENYLGANTAATFNDVLYLPQGTYNFTVTYHPDAINNVNATGQLSLSIVKKQKTVTFSENIEPKLTFNYDDKSNPIEVMKTGDVTTSYIWDYNESLPIAKAENTSQANVAYTSFESDGKGTWQFSGVPVNAPDNFTPVGTKAYLLTAETSLTRAGLNSSMSYVVSYWHRSNASISVTGGTSSDIKSFNGLHGWILSTRKISNAISITVSGTGYIDDIRLCPSDAQITTYTYEPLIGMTSSTDTNHVTTYYQYDEFGRLRSVKDNNGNILKKYSYHYSGQ